MFDVNVLVLWVETSFLDSILHPVLLSRGKHLATSCAYTHKETFFVESKICAQIHAGDL